MWLAAVTAFLFIPVTIMAFGPSRAAKTWTPTSDNNNGSVTFEFRAAATGLGSPGATQIRVSFAASTSGGITCQHVSVGKTATAPSTVGTPVELKFSGSSGFTLSSGQSITSDWANFDYAPGDGVMVIRDATVNNDRTVAAADCEFWYKSGSTEWNVASVTGFTDGGASAVGITGIELR